MPRHARTGFVTFRVHGSHLRHVRWYVNGKRHGAHRFEHRWDRGRRLTVPVWSREIWARGLPGIHTVTAHAKTPCGSVIVRLRYPNVDPPLVARTARSSWGVAGP